MRQLGIALIVGTMVTGCATTPPEEDPVQIKLRELDERLARIERVMSNQSLLDMAQRLDSIQTDVRTIRGRTEELENGVEGLRKQQRNLYSDLDKRIAAIGAAPAGSVAAASVAGAAAEQAYSQAFDQLKAGNYPAAIVGFRQFLATYPDSDLAENAQYWLGEAYYVTRDYTNAAAAFREAVARWPSSRKTADAMVKLGYTQAEQRQFAEARATLTEVVQRFPDTDAARLANERLARLPAGGR